jgi:ABC-2 type transport system permease protein
MNARPRSSVNHGPVSGATAGGRFVPALRAEWTKLWSLPSSTWSVLAIVGLTVLFTLFLAAVASTDATRAGQGDDDVVVNSLRGVYLGQIAVVSFAVVAITSEFGTGMIRTTFAAMPNRGAALGAKVTVVSGVVLVAASVASVASFLVAQPLLHGGGFVPPAYPLVSLGDASAVRAVAGTAAFMTVLALIGLGIGTLLRNTTLAISWVLGLLLIPLVMTAFLPERMQELVQELTPIAGLAIQSTVERPDNLPIGPWGGLGVTCVWAAASLLAAFWSIIARDA